MTEVSAGASRKRIGLIYPSSGVAEEEFIKLAPESVSVHVTRIWFTEATVQQLLEMVRYVEEAATLLASARVDVINFACTSGSLVKGLGYDQELISAIERKTGIPATTNTTAVVSALRELEAQRLVVVTAYPDDVNLLEKRFLEDSGFQVLKIAGRGLLYPHDQYAEEPYTWYRMAEENFSDAADAVFISCGGIRTVDVIDRIEKRLSRPVVTSNQAAMWHCLRKLGLKISVNGYGRLLSGDTRRPTL